MEEDIILKEFEILHFSARFNDYDEDRIARWSRVNIVFRAFQNEDKSIYAKSMAMANAEDWCKATVYSDPKLVDQFFLETRVKFVKIPGSNLSKLVRASHPTIDLESLKTSGWTMNNDCYLSYIEKFDVFVFRDYIEDNEITRATLNILEGMKNEQHVNTSRFTDYSLFQRCLSTLHLFWD
jgi:hypothetical protein